MERTQPAANEYSAAGQSRPIDTTEGSPDSSLMRKERDSKQEKRIKQHTKKAKRFWKDTWAPEVLSCVIALSALLGMAITLKIRQERPTPQWPSGISLNTLVAVFSAIIKAALVMPVGEGISQLKFLWFRRNRTLADLDDFDEASRGPWGSFWFMIQPEPHYLATFGAFITVAALAVDPFSQQILQTYSCSEVIPDLTASIPRGNNFSVNIVTSAMPGKGYPPLDSQIEEDIMLGAIQPPQNVSSQISFQCPSGNCSFPASAGATYEAIAMCSSCKDISDAIVYLQDQNTTCNYGLSDALRGPNNTMSNDTMPLGSYDIRTRKIEFTTDLLTFESVMYTGVDPSYRRQATSKDGSCSRVRRKFATRCSLIPCVQSYAATITNFTLREELVSSTNMVYHPGSFWPWGHFTLVTNSTIRNGVRHDCTNTDHATAENTIPINRNNTLIVTDPQVSVDRNISHWVSPHCVFHWGLNVAAVTGVLQTMYNNRSAFSGIGDLWIKKFYHQGNATLDTANEYMKGLAISMSATMRNSQNATQDPALGAVYVQQTCVRIKWAWISLPASLVLMAIMFLVVTMWSSLTQSWHGMWKSSSLALVLASVESETLLQAGILDKKSQMSNTAKSMEVQFMKTERGWGFVEH